MTYICISKLTIIGSDNGLLPEQRQAIILTKAGLLLIGLNKHQRTFNRNSNILIQENSLTMSSAIGIHFVLDSVW